MKKPRDKLQNLQKRVILLREEYLKSIEKQGKTVLCENTKQSRIIRVEVLDKILAWINELKDL